MRREVVLLTARQCVRDQQLLKHVVVRGMREHWGVWGVRREERVCLGDGVGWGGGA